MTEAEKKEIVALVMSEISGQAVDFDLQTVTPQRTDILPAVRPDGAGGYTGVTLDWGGITDELTTQAKGFRDEALQAKRDTELLKSETNDIKSEVNDIYTQFNQVVDSTIESVRNVYQSDLNAESTARQTADNTLQQNIDSEASTRAEADTAIGARIDSETTTRESEVAELERVNAIQKYEIENLKAKAEGQIYRTEVVDTEAYSLDVPSSVSPYAEVQKIGGKSVVWNQLVPPYNKTQSANGITIAGDGSGKLTITVSSEVTGYNQVTLGRINLIQGHKYLMFDGDKENGFELYISGYTGINGKLFIFAANSTSSQDILYYVNQTSHSGTYIKHPMTIDLTQMFGSGNEPTLEECKKIFSADYYPYDAGTIKSFPVQSVKSVGKNKAKINVFSNAATDTKAFFQPQVQTVRDRKVIGNYGTPSSTVTGKYTISFTTPSDFDLVQFKHNGSSKDLYIEKFNTILIKPNTNYVLSMYIESSDPTSIGGIKVRDIQLEEGSTATDYTPYKETMLDVSSLTSDLKSAGSVHDEWQNGNVTKRVVSVELGTLNCKYWSSKQCFSFELPNRDIKGSILCNKYKVVDGVNYSNWQNVDDKSIFASTSENLIVVKDTSYTDLTTFKQAMSGVMLYYELATPTESEVPEIDNYLEVEGGGSLTFESDDAVHMPVPSTDRFVVDLT